MHLLYLDESGVPEPHPTQTSHYVLLGLSVFEGTWFAVSRKVRELKKRYAREDPGNFELHAAWIRRPYWEQEEIPDFEDLGAEARWQAVEELRKRRKEEDWPGLPGRKVREERRYFRNTRPYAHLLLSERERLLDEALSIVGDHRRGVVLFAEAINKKSLHWAADPIDQGFTQVVTRFEAFLQRRKKKQWGLLVVDYDENKASRLASMLEKFQRQGARWRDIDRVVEVPFFTASHENVGVQLSDLCAYALRRYLENDEEGRFRLILDKFDRTPTGLHGLRHYTARGCPCLICRERGH